MGKFFTAIIAVCCLGYSAVAFCGPVKPCDFSNPDMHSDPGIVGTLTSIVLKTASMNIQLALEGGSVDLKKSDAKVRLCYRNAMKFAHDTSVGNALQSAYAKYLLAFESPSARSVNELNDSIAGVEAAADGYVGKAQK